MAGRLEPTGIIDIGSNSVRFVSYAGNARVPSHLFNEKVLPALGRGVEQDGKLDEGAMEQAMAALSRYRMLADAMGLSSLKAVATAAVRDASNGDEFLSRLRLLGLKPRVLTGEEEAELAALGVLSGIPWADGIVADLGGGSIELADVAGGEVGRRSTLPLGVLRIGDRTVKKLGKAISAATDWGKAAKRRNLYLVGGSFRALARLDLHDMRHPLPIVHQHTLTAQRISRIEQMLAEKSKRELMRKSGLTAGRVPLLPAALKMLHALIEQFRPEKIFVSAYGLREGILFSALPAGTREEDPLIAAAYEVGEQLGRFGHHGATIDRWIEPLFEDESKRMSRLRLASCLMSDFAWNAHPEFRAERAVDLALHGNWVGVNANDRAIMGRALCTAFSSDHGLSSRITALLTKEQEHRANGWGRAIRVAQRLSGGTEAILERTRLVRDGTAIVLQLPRGQIELSGESVARRLELLTKALDADEWRIELRN